MKKQNVINLIKYHTEGNEPAFRSEAYTIAEDFVRSGDKQIGHYILTLLSDQNVFIPQELEDDDSLFRRVDTETSSLKLPTPIYDDIIGIANASSYDSGINRFLFAGAPGTGKTESAKQLARILRRELYSVDFDTLIDSKLGQTAKNISALFDSINNLRSSNIVILFDEIDALAMDRLDSHDMREMGRATSAVLKGFDNLHTSAVIIATTNLLSSFDKAFIRRFDKIVDFNRYSRDDLLEIADSIMESLLQRFSFASRNIRLFHKLIGLMDNIPYPGDLKNMLQSAVAFSNPADGYDYFRKLFKEIMPDFSYELKDFQKLGFTVREIEILTAVSKSKVSRMLRGRDE